MKKKILIALAVLLGASISIGSVIIVQQRGARPVIPELENRSSSAPAAAEQSSSIYEVPELKPSSESKPASSSKPESTVTRVEDENGNVEIIDSAYSKPEAPEKPKVDDSQLHDPNSKPTYTEDQTKPNQNEDNSQPQNGDENEKGEVWVPGFGWIKPAPVTDTPYIDKDAGKGEIIGH